MAETQIVPDGFKKGYLEVIDFDAISNRIKNFKTDLLDICKKKVKSFYRKNITKIYHEIGNKANMAMGLMNRFESFQVILLNLTYFDIYTIYKCYEPVVQSKLRKFLSRLSAIY